MEHFCCENILQYLANIVTIIGFMLAIVGIILAWIEFRKNQLIKRAEFYTLLFDKLFKDNSYQRIRERLDAENYTEDYYKVLNKDLKDEKTKLLSEMTDYLNYLEYVMVMQKIKVIKHDDVINLLDYYLKSLSKNKIAIDYIKNYGFENLESKIKQLNLKYD